MRTSETRWNRKIRPASNYPRYCLAPFASLYQRDPTWSSFPTALFTLTHSLTAFIVFGIVFLTYTQIENHILNPIVMSRTVRINPLLVLIAILVGANVGDLVGGFFGGFVGTLLAIPLAGALQVIVREVWQSTAPEAQLQIVGGDRSPPSVP